MRNACTLTTGTGGEIIFTSPYHSGLIADMKARIPGSDRRWDPERRVWLIASSRISVLQDLVTQYFGEALPVLRVTTCAPKFERRILEVRYLGSTKERAPGDMSAYGYDGMEWKFVFPERVLMDWFEDASATQNVSISLYAVLGVRQDVDAENLKIAYRRMAKQWHPDVCKEPDATERFQRINQAFEILSDGGKRSRYDAGLALSFSTSSDHHPFGYGSRSAMSYRAPLRCGLIMAEGVEMMGRFVVEKILMWQDIVNPAGQVLVSSWSAGANKPTEVWV